MATGNSQNGHFSGKIIELNGGFSICYLKLRPTNIILEAIKPNNQYIYICILHIPHFSCLRIPIFGVSNLVPSHRWHGWKRQIRRCQLSVRHAGIAPLRHSQQRQQQQRQRHGAERGDGRGGDELTPCERTRRMGWICGDPIVS